MKLSQVLTASLTASLLLVACGSSTTDNTGGAGGNSGGNKDSGAGTGGAVAKCISGNDELIADFKTDNGLNPADGRQGGFYVYPGSNESKGIFEPPKVGDDPYPIDKSNGNLDCSGNGSFHTKATGFVEWGAAMGTDLAPKDGKNKGFYDASKYKGVSFWAKASAALTGVQVSFPDMYTDGGADPSTVDSSASQCVYVGGSTINCSPYLVKLGDAAFPNYTDYKIDTTWKRFDILFADTKQDAYNTGFHTEADKVDTKHLTAFAVQVNAIYVNGSPTANDFELWIDDIYFIK